MEQNKHIFHDAVSMMHPSVVQSFQRSSQSYHRVNILNSKFLQVKFVFKNHISKDWELLEQIQKVLCEQSHIKDAVPGCTKSSSDVPFWPIFHIETYCKDKKQAKIRAGNLLLFFSCLVSKVEHCDKSAFYDILHQRYCQCNRIKLTIFQGKEKY